MSLPNVITIARILLVPLAIWLIVTGQFLLAFLTFLAAGISDGVDGFIARRYNLKTELGAYLDALADKLLLVSIYMTLGFLKVLPAWLVILVASRDVLIVGAVLLSMLMERPVRIRPHMVSKVNTTVQIILAGAVLALLGFEREPGPMILVGQFVVAGFTVASGALYMREWVRHMANGHSRDAP